jgi:hypothetical protein
MISTATAMFVLFLVYAYIFFKDKLEEEGKTMFSWMDLIHLLLQLLIRCMVVAVKYGYYSEEHYTIFKNLLTPKEL